ncbi:MAG: hypothetical protein GYA33_13840, partial [Thermogutta sp.]|nr:hypothetical protein [Thermogutta sp.]
MMRRSQGSILPVLVSLRLFAGYILLCAGSVLAGGPDGGNARLQGAAQVQLLPELAQAENWQVEKGTGALSLAQRENSLRISFNTGAGNSGTLLLKTPLPIPTWATGFTFLGCKDVPRCTQMDILLLVKDGAGNQYKFYTNSGGTESHASGNYMGARWYNGALEGVGQVRFTVPALKYLASPPFGQGPTQFYVDAGTGLPKPPYTLLGFYIGGRYREGWVDAVNVSTTLYLHDFAFTRLEPKQARFYYSFNDQEHYGELDPVPYVTLADFVDNQNLYGRTFQVIWEVRDNYAGQPILMGNKNFTLPTGSKDTSADYLWHLLQRIEIPVFDPGTYWVRFKVRWAVADTIIPDRIIVKDFRLYIPGKQAFDKPIIPATE